MTITANNASGSFFSPLPEEESIIRTVFDGLSYTWLDQETPTILTAPTPESLIVWGSPNLQLSFSPNRQIDPDYVLDIREGELYQLQINDKLYSSELLLNSDWSFLCIWDYGPVPSDSKTRGFEFSIWEDRSINQVKSYIFDVDGSFSSGIADAEQYTSIADIQQSHYDVFVDGSWSLTQPSERVLTIADATFGSSSQIDSFEEGVELESPIQDQGSETERHSLDLIAKIFGSVLYLEGLTEVVTATTHTIEYNGTVFNYSEVDQFVMTVVRDGAFTSEFSLEIAESFPDNSGITYDTALALIGQANIESTLMMVAGADGNYVG